MKKTFLVIALGIFAVVSTPGRANCSRHVCEGASDVKVVWACDYAFVNPTLIIEGGRVSLGSRLNVPKELDAVLTAGALYRVEISDSLRRAAVIRNHALLGEMLVASLQCRH